MTVTAPEFSLIPKWVAAAGSVLLTAIYLAQPVYVTFVAHEFDMFSLAMWFFVVFLLAFIEFKIRTPEDLSTFGGWSKPMAVLFASMLVFARYFYPRLKVSWGGGTPSNVTVYINKDSLLYPNKSVPAQLIEESDEGYYITGLKESKAIFVPRSAVAMVYFADKPADSPMLQNSKP